MKETAEVVRQRVAPQYESGEVANRGFRYDEASAFIELCVDLDNQDDRLKYPAKSELIPRINANEWKLVFDSRREVAKDVEQYETRPAEDDHWSKLYRFILDAASRKQEKHWTEKELEADPDLNGFGPWQNAWTLYRGKGKFAGSYAIAIRGTVFSNQPSATEDAWFHAVGALSFLSKGVNFAYSTNATLHSGFAHATFSLLLDDRYGILRVLSEHSIPNDARIYIVGHSQGAAMATLVHAFLHHAIEFDLSAKSPLFGLEARRFKLKSYGFAQPKPGNFVFAADFAAITQRTDNAIVINNVADSVPQVPLTLQGTGDLESNFKGASLALRGLQFVSSAGKGIRLAVAVAAEPFVRKSAEGYGYFYGYQQIKPIGTDDTASSWNFSPAGHVLYVFGEPSAPDDLFLAHHATTYRRLIEEQLSKL